MRPFSLVITGTLLLTLGLSIKAQDAFSDFPGAQRVRQTLDSVQAYTPMQVHGQYVRTELVLEHAEHTQFFEKEIYTFRFKRKGLALRALLHIGNLGQSDTLKVFNGGRQLQFFTYKNLWQQELITALAQEELSLHLVWRSMEKPVFSVRELLLVPLPALSKTTDFGDAGDCQVNVACPEGDERRDQIRSVVRILVRIGNIAGWCTGTVLNNVAYNYEPLILSAEHCGLFNNAFASPQDLNRWVFFFNYQSPDCSDPPVEGNLDDFFLAGAQLLARSDDEGGETGSDMLLLRLNTSIPEAFNVYYAGWNRSGGISPEQGYCIHHPEGDIKKISSMSGSARSGAFGSNADNTHWLVQWRATANGFGTTEGGSSGSPLFDDNGLVTGQLTGGLSGCSTPNGEDFYGKFSYNWTSNGQSPDRQLLPWLDPLNTGLLALGGANLNDLPPVDTLTYSLAPVPANTHIDLKGLGNSTESVNIQIFSATGALVYSDALIMLPNIPERISLTRFRSGWYFARITQGAQTYTTSFVVSKVNGP